MARMIDANRLKDAIYTDFWGHFTQCHDSDQTALIDMVMDDIDEMPTLTPPNEWVSVEERLPEDKQIVLFHQKNGFIYCAEYSAGNKLLSPAWFIDNDCWEANEVTHWMPLPAPPDRRPPEGEEDT